MEAIERIRRQKLSMAFSYGRLDQLVYFVKQIFLNSIPGDLVECGVWKGGNCMVIAELLKRQNSEKMIWLYDTFEGMPKPDNVDVKFTGERAEDKWHPGWCRSPFQEVEKNMKSTDYPYYKMIKGKVEDTIPKEAPEQIALLRLDTDFYSSTKHELIHLYPRLVEGGFLIIDDYHSWQGSRKACDEILPNRNFKRIGGSNASWLMK